MVHVTSEIGRLRQVLMHRPGAEVDQMVPSMMEDLLFDDILFGDVARAEHECFRCVLELSGIEVLEAKELLTASLARPEAREWIYQSFLEDLPRAMRQRLSEAGDAELADTVITGIRLDPQLAGMEAGELFEVAPLPNWCFQRDPVVALGDRVVFSSMATSARWREALISSTIFRFHERFASTPVILDPLLPEEGGPIILGLHRPHYEGGDILVLSKDVVAIGLSERTNLTGIRILARALRELEDRPRWLIVVALPRSRAYMHLDTVITPVDANACLVYPPVILPGSSEEARVYEIDLHSGESYPQPRSGLLKTLARRGIDLQPIPCGGSDAVRQQREQWTDGANAFALAPGVIALYDRNTGTIEELDRHGFEIVEAGQLIEEERGVDLDAGKRVCILLPSHELSRARGGPHCLTQPMRRDDLA